MQPRVNKVSKSFGVSTKGHDFHAPYVMSSSGARKIWLEWWQQYTIREITTEHGVQLEFYYLDDHWYRVNAKDHKLNGYQRDDNLFYTK